MHAYIHTHTHAHIIHTYIHTHIHVYVLRSESPGDVLLVKRVHNVSRINCEMSQNIVRAFIFYCNIGIPMCEITKHVSQTISKYYIIYVTPLNEKCVKIL
jgi:hypothetical protein